MRTATTTMLADQLAQSAVFAKAGQDVLHTLAENAERIDLRSREHLFYLGEVATHFYLVATGSIYLYRPSYTGERKIFRTLEDGDLLVETAMFLDPPEYPMSAQAHSNATCWRIPRADLLQVCRASPEFSLAMLEEMAVRISQSLNRIDLLTVGNAPQRLVLYLLDIHQQQGTAWLTLPASQAVLSRQLNITPETLSRLLASFRRTGRIGAARRERNPHQMQVVLLDVAGLCKDVGLPPPETQPTRAPRHLGNSLFDCCNYARMALGRALR